MTFLVFVKCGKQMTFIILSKVKLGRQKTSEFELPGEWAEVTLWDVHVSHLGIC